MAFNAIGQPVLAIAIRSCVVFDSGLGELKIDSISNSFEIKLEYPHGCV